MEVIICPSPEKAANYAGRMVADLVTKKPDAVLGLATGSTPLGLYGEMIRHHKENHLDFSGVRTFNLDEYVGLKPEDPQSYRYFMQQNLFDHINTVPSNTHVPDGVAADIPAECAAYEAAIVAAGGLDLQVLGIGTDGHIGFNEMTSSFASRTRIKTITRQTTEDNARFFEDESDVPQHCITMGIGTIMEAQEVVLLAFGEGKAETIRDTVEGPIAAINPASILQMHQRATILVDEAAASKLAHRDYYDWVFHNKPKWQRV